MDNGYTSEIKRLLDKMLESNFDISQHNLKQFTNNLPVLFSDPDIRELFFTSWFKKFIEISKASPTNISTKAILLIADIAGIICLEEKVFLNLNFSGMIDYLSLIIQRYPKFQEDELIQEYYIRLLTGFTSHKAGLQWMIATNSWYDILKIIQEKNVDGFVFKEGCKFLVNILDMCKIDNEIFHGNAIKILIAPIFQLTKWSSSEQEMDTGEVLKYVTRLNVLENIINKMLVISCSKKDFRFINMLQERFQLEQLLEQLASNEKLKDLHLQFNRLQSSVIYFILAKTLRENSVNDLERTTHLNHFSSKIYDILLQTANSISEYSAVLELLYENYRNFTYVVDGLERSVDATTEFQYQMLPFILYPIRKVFFSITGRKSSSRTSSPNELKEELITKMLRNFLPLTITTHAKFNRECTKEDALAGFHHIQKYSRFYDRSVIVTLIQIMIHKFNDMLEFLLKSTDSVLESAHEYLLATLETIIYLLNEFDISWNDSIETLYITEDVVELLNMPNSPEKLTIRGLQLLDITVRKKLSPRMHLLVDSVPEGLSNFQQNLFTNLLNDKNWEIRNAMVQVIHAIAQTKKEFVSTKVILRTFDCPEKIFNLMTNDKEICVKISALRCLRDILIFDTLWEDLIKISDFYDRIMQMYYLEKDDVLRSETIGLITTIYENRNLPDNTLEKFYDIMTYAVLDDDFWSVKVDALCFWQKVINKHLSEAGMVDGEFPSVIFSKKLKKIVTFDESVIQSSLEKVLYQLDAIGCLTVVLFALKYELETVKDAAVNLIKPFVQLLRKYKISTGAFQNNVQKSPDSMYSSPGSSLSSTTLLSTPSSNMFSPFPESFLNDIMDIEESLGSDSNIIQTILEDSEMDIDNPEATHINQFMKFVETFDFSINNKPLPDGIKLLLDDILR